MNLALYIFLGIGLSMDAFSLILVYSNYITKKNAIILSLIVGIFHFIMPNIGNILGKTIVNLLVVKANLIMGIIFLILGIEMILSLKDKKEILPINKLYQMLFFSLVVSLDSMSTGVALSLSNNNIIVAGIIFSLISFIFMLAGTFIGKKGKTYLGNKATIIGSIILILMQ